MIADLIIPYVSLIKEFGRDTYEKAFLDYEEKCSGLIRDLINGYQDNEEQEAFLFNEALQYVQAIKNTTINNPELRKSRASKIYEDYRLVTLFYTIPMLGRSNNSIPHKFIDALVVVWPEAKLNISTYDNLKNGFRGSIFEDIFGKRKKKTDS